MHDARLGNPPGSRDPRMDPQHGKPGSFAGTAAAARSAAACTHGKASHCRHAYIVRHRPARPPEVALGRSTCGLAFRHPGKPWLTHRGGRFQMSARNPARCARERSAKWRRQTHAKIVAIAVRKQRQAKGTFSRSERPGGWRGIPPTSDAGGAQYTSRSSMQRPYLYSIRGHSGSEYTSAVHAVHSFQVTLSALGSLSRSVRPANRNPNPSEATNARAVNRQ